MFYEYELLIQHASEWILQHWKLRMFERALKERVFIYAHFIISSLVRIDDNNRGQSPSLILHVISM